MNSQKDTTVLILRGVSLFFGLLLLLFGIGDLLIPRARFISSSPEPGATLTSPPTSVIIRFSNELSAESEIDVISTIRMLPSGERQYLYQKLVAVSEIDPTEPSRRTMRAFLLPSLHNGLYFINWRTTSAGWGAMTFGKTAFGVGMSVPEYITRDMGGTIYERTNQWRGRRAALVGGVILIVMAFGLTLLKRS